MMKIKAYTLLAFAMLVTLLCSCNDYETYADKRDKEKKAISEFIAGKTDISKEVFGKSINVISETEFETNGCKTDINRNEFVLFESTGVYMQIVREGCGEKMKSGETSTVLCRFSEYNLLQDSLQLTNIALQYAGLPEKMTVFCSSGSFTGTFVNGYSLMASMYSSTAVPSGWLVPLRYIKLGRPSKEGDETALVRLIVPAAQGQAYANQNVYPCYYEITYEKGY